LGGFDVHSPAPTLSEPDRAMLGRSRQRFAPLQAKGAIVLTDAKATRSTAADKPIQRVTPEPSVQDVMLAAIPNLRAFAMSLSGSADRADDLVQETVMRAMANIDSFTPGTNMAAWLFTILRNRFRSEYRKRRREVEDPDGSYLASLKLPPEQFGRLEFKELIEALAKLPHVQREALLLVAASGFSYDEAAAICGIAVGTIKSRVSRARQLLAELLVIGSPAKFGLDRATALVGTGW
jgi:RNA polymerase sigma-70 factor, ECF subfamily